MALFSRQLKWLESFQKNGNKESSGKLISLYNVKDIPTFDVVYIYAITIPVDKIKGPYFHTVRTTVVTILYGSVDLIFYNNTINDYEFIQLVGETPVQIIITPKTPFCFKGVSKESMMINYCDYPWEPKSNECIVPDFTDCKYI